MKVRLSVVSGNVDLLIGQNAYTCVVFHFKMTSPCPCVDQDYWMFCARYYCYSQELQGQSG